MWALPFPALVKSMWYVNLQGKKISSRLPPWNPEVKGDEGRDQGYGVSLQHIFQLRLKKFFYTFNLLLFIKHMHREIQSGW